MEKTFNGKKFYTCTSCDRFITHENYSKLINTKKEWLEQGEFHICTNCKKMK